MTETEPSTHAVLMWARRWAMHPTVLVVARVSIAALAIGVGTAATFLTSIDSRLNAAIISQNIKFVQIDAKIEETSNRMDLGRDDRIRFQSDALDALDRLVDGQSQALANDAAQNERLKSIEARLSRIEDQD